MLSLKQIYLKDLEKVRQLSDFLQNFQSTFAQTLSLAGVLRTEIPMLLSQEEEQVLALKEINEKEAKTAKLKEKLDELKEKNQELYHIFRLESIPNLINERDTRKTENEEIEAITENIQKSIDEISRKVSEQKAYNDSLYFNYADIEKKKQKQDLLIKKTKHKTRDLEKKVEVLSMNCEDKYSDLKRINGILEEDGVRSEILISSIYELKCKKNQLIYDESKKYVDEFKSCLKSFSLNQSEYCSVCGDKKVGRTKICVKCQMSVHFKCLSSDGKYCINCAR